MMSSYISSTPVDSDLDDDFSQPPAEEIQQLIENIKNTQGILDH